MSFPDHLTPDPDGPPAGGDQYTERDIGNEVFIIHEGVAYYDTIVQVTLPDGQVIIGPMLTCGQLFARFSMCVDTVCPACGLPTAGMMTQSRLAQERMDDGEVDA